MQRLHLNQQEEQEHQQLEADLMLGKLDNNPCNK
jgi:hypothetical protein